MFIDRYISSKSDLRQNLIDPISEILVVNLREADELYNRLLPHIDQIIDAAWVFIEFPYVDKVYRDSYYNYYSSKSNTYSKNCIRLSFFENEINNENFRTVEGIADLQNRFLGYVIIRPTPPSITGRSMLNLKAVKNSTNLLGISTKVNVTVNFVKFELSGFPHSSQDGETISCAETTLWSVMEYFGHKYPDYKPTLPSKITAALRRVSTERQIPSTGLSISQMSYALREFGFGTKIYAKSEFGADEFKRLFSCYIESGIPLIVSMNNAQIGHALIAVGHSKITEGNINALLPSNETNQDIANKIQQKQILFYDNDDIDKEFVFIDDNRPVYQLAKFDAPSAHYQSPSWANCSINAFVVPLYPKIYLEAFEAKSFLKKTLFELFPIPDGSEIFLRFYLSSSRSLKNELAISQDFDNDIKDIILQMFMPKFVWVGELSNLALIKDQKANGIVILDATEANKLQLKPLILAAFNNSLIYFDHNSLNFNNITIPLPNFSIFINNLKGY